MNLYRWIAQNIRSKQNRNKKRLYLCITMATRMHLTMVTNCGTPCGKFSVLFFLKYKFIGAFHQCRWLSVQKYVIHCIDSSTVMNTEFYTKDQMNFDSTFNLSSIECPVFIKAKSIHQLR